MFVRNFEAPGDAGYQARPGTSLSEVANLKVLDLDRQPRVIWVRGGKGQKDRQVMLSEPLREVLAVGLGRSAG